MTARLAPEGRAWNDALDDEQRQMLKPYVFRVLGTNTGAADELRRAWLATDSLYEQFSADHALPAGAG